MTWLRRSAYELPVSAQPLSPQARARATRRAWVRLRWRIVLERGASATICLIFEKFQVHNDTEKLPGRLAIPPGPARPSPIDRGFECSRKLVKYRTMGVAGRVRLNPVQVTQIFSARAQQGRDAAATLAHFPPVGFVLRFLMAVALAPCALAAGVPADLIDDPHVREEMGVNAYTAPSLGKIIEDLAFLRPEPAAEHLRQVAAGGELFEPLPARLELRLAHRRRVDHGGERGAGGLQQPRPGPAQAGARARGRRGNAPPQPERARSGGAQEMGRPAQGAGRRAARGGGRPGPVARRGNRPFHRAGRLAARPRGVDRRGAGRLLAATRGQAAAARPAGIFRLAAR